MRCRRAALHILLPVLALRAAAATDLPEGWFRSGKSPQDYEMKVDAAVQHEGRNALRLRSLRASDGFATVMTKVPAEPYRGQKLRFSAAVRWADVTGQAGLWMRVDGQTPGRPLAFDNMHDRALRGTHDWERYEVVLPVEREAGQIAYGLLLGGEGQTWLDDVRLEVVPDTVPPTGTPVPPRPAPGPPTNLDFEEPSGTH
jgi:hypothetical protein